MTKKRWLMIATAIAVLAISLLGAWWVLRGEEESIDAEVFLSQGLKNTAAAQSFRYTLDSSLKVDGREEVISKVAGEKSPEGNIHIKGEMVKTPVDIYHFEQAIYQFDSFSKRWLVIKDAQCNSTKVLMTELDPLSNFNFKNIGEIQKTSTETVNGSRCAVICCKPSVENELMEILWQDFNYKIWVDMRERVIKKATLSAVSKNNEKTFLQLNVAFDDYNDKIAINKPDVE